MKTWLRKLFASKATTPIRNLAPIRLQAEVLETREVLATSFNPTTGLLSVTGTEGGDQIQIDWVQHPSGTHLSTIQVRVNGGLEASLPAFWYDGRYWINNVKSLEVNAGGGNDTVRNNTWLPSTIFGGAGDDWLIGGAGRDMLIGWTGNDTLEGLGDNDELYGGIGNDNLYGGEGSDKLAGQENDDLLVGGNGDDDLYGDSGRDKLFGQAGADKLYGGTENDLLVGGSDSDYLDGHDGDDELYGDDHTNIAPGNDTLCGGAGNDKLAGQGGHDILYGWTGNDTLYGDDGNDKLYGEAGTDTLYGGGGDDFLDAGSAGEFADGGNGKDFNAYVIAVNGAYYTDIVQGSAPNCWVLSGLAVATRRIDNDLLSRIEYLGHGLYKIQWLRPDRMGQMCQYVRFDGTPRGGDPVTSEQDGSGWAESWVTLYNRAILQQAGRDLDNPGSGGAYLEPQLYLNRDYQDISPTNRDAIISGVFAGQAVMAFIPSENTTAAAIGLPDWHWYTVLAVYS
jgi:hypothetical protein